MVHIPCCRTATSSWMVTIREVISLWVVVTSCMAIGLVQTASAQTVDAGFHVRTVLHGEMEQGYQVYLPPGYTPDESWPVVLFLHGYGEQGEDNQKQIETGIAEAFVQHPGVWPVIGVFPQAPTGTAWHGETAEMAMRALAQTQKEFSVDPSRIYITGLSMGGYGTWNVAFEHPDVFAAAVVVCGFVHPIREYYPVFAPTGQAGWDQVADRLKSMPIWIYHGDEDTVVPIEEARAMNAALQALEADVRYSELLGVGHNAWDAAYTDLAMAEWMLDQRKVKTVMESPE